MEGEQTLKEGANKSLNLLEFFINLFLSPVTIVL